MKDFIKLLLFGLTVGTLIAVSINTNKILTRLNLYDSQLAKIRFDLESHRPVTTTSTTNHVGVITTNLNYFIPN